MLTEQEMIQLLASANRRGVHDVDGSLFPGLDREAAYRVQFGVMRELGATPAILKTGIHADGVGVVAPIFTLGESGSFRQPVANITGVEVEVGLVLGRDLPDGADPAAVAAAVDHYFVGVEICGSRFLDRTLAGITGGLADGMSALAYCRSTTARALGNAIDGLEVEVTFAGAQLYRAPAKHGFVTVLASLAAYAKSQRPEYSLKAGTVITTGSLCGLVPTTGPGHVVARLGGETVEFDIV